jgi:peptidyl-prolyl cis-trans isomerase C
VEQLVKREIAGTVSVSEVEIDTYYASNRDRYQRPEGVHIRHILISVPLGAGPEARAAGMKEIDAVVKKLAEGAAFVALARQHSDCPSGSRGGDLGFISRGEQDASFESVAFSLQPGSVSDTVETPYGYHLIEVLERRPPRKIKRDEVAGRLREQIRKSKIKRSLQEHLEGLYARSSIEIRR